MTDAYGNDAATSTGTIADTTNNAASGAPQRAESTERLARPLIKLAKACGLATSFIDQLGTYTEISDAALVAVLKALDVDASSDEAIVRSMTQLEVENSKRLLPSTIVATTGKPTGITLNCSSDADITASIELEDGTAFGHFALLPNLNSGKPDLTIAPDLPMGYHTLTVTVNGREGKAAIIAAPARIPVPEAVAEHQRLVGQHLLICHQQWGRRVARTVEIFLRRFLRQGTAEVAGDLLRLARINAEYLGVGMGAAHQRGIRHVRYSEIICILSESRCLVRGLKARCLTIDNGEFSLLHHACSSFPFAYTSMTSAAATMAASIFV